MLWSFLFLATSSYCTRALATALVPLLFFGTSRVTRQRIHGRIWYFRHTNLRLDVFTNRAYVRLWDGLGFGLDCFWFRFLVSFTQNWPHWGGSLSTLYSNFTLTQCTLRGVGTRKFQMFVYSFRVCFVPCASQCVTSFASVTFIAHLFYCC